MKKEIKASMRLRDFQLVVADVPYAVETLKRFSSNGVKLISQFVKIKFGFHIMMNNSPLWLYERVNQTKVVCGEA